jgi:hypothetical protein
MYKKIEFIYEPIIGLAQVFLKQQWDSLNPNKEHKKETQ